jgi:hypothetical protein
LGSKEYLIVICLSSFIVLLRILEYCFLLRKECLDGKGKVVEESKVAIVSEEGMVKGSGNIGMN